MQESLGHDCSVNFSVKFFTAPSLRLAHRYKDSPRALTVIYIGRCQFGSVLLISHAFFLDLH